MQPGEQIDSSVDVLSHINVLIDCRIGALADIHTSVLLGCCRIGVLTDSRTVVLTRMRSY